MLCLLAPSSHDMEYEEKTKRLTSMGFSQVGIWFQCCIFLQLYYLIKEMFIHVSRRCSGLVICALISRLSGPDSSHGHCVVFLGKTLLVQCLSPPMCVDEHGKFNAWGTL